MRTSAFTVQKRQKMKRNKLRVMAGIFALVAAGTTANAQQTQVGIRAGLNFSNIVSKNESGNKENTKSIPGIQLGITVDVPLAGSFYVQPAALYSRQGFKQETDGFSSTSTNFEVKTNYIQVPVNLLYKPKLGPGRLLLGAGPYVAFGTGGSWKSGNNVILGDINIGNKGDVVFKKDAADGGGLESYVYGKPVDYGGSFLAGYEFLNQLSIQLNAQVGVSNLAPQYQGTESKRKLRNSGFGISLGYKF